MTSCAPRTELATVSIVIVTWHAEDVIGACLASIAQQRYGGGVETIVLDNASSDGTIAAVHASGVPVTLIESRENLGFGRGNNAAAEAATGALLFFLNPDTVLPSRDTISDLVSGLTRVSGTGLVAPRLLNADGSVQPSIALFTRPLSAFVVTFGLHRLMRGRLRDRWSPPGGSLPYAADVDWVKGAAVLLRADLFRQVGGWSTQTFMYAEDQQLCWDVRAAGRRVRFDPSAAVVHLDDHASSKRWDDAARADRVARATARMVLDRYGPAPARTTLALTWARHTIRRVVSLLRGSPAAANAHRAAAAVYLRAAIAGTPGPDVQ